MRGWLKDLRLRMLLTEKEIADMTGIGQPFYHLVEHGDRNPSVDTAKRIAAVLGFDWTRFFEDEAVKDDKEKGA